MRDLASARDLAKGMPKSEKPVLPGRRPRACSSDLGRFRAPDSPQVASPITTMTGSQVRRRSPELTAARALLKENVNATNRSVKFSQDLLHKLGDVCSVGIYASRQNSMDEGAPSCISTMADSCSESEFSMTSGR